MKIQIGLLAILVLFSVLVPTLVFAGTTGPSPIPNPPGFQISTTTLTLCKGTVNTVPIRVTNPGQGGATMEDVQLSIQGSKNVYSTGNGTLSAVNITGNSSKIIDLPVFVSLNTSSLISAGIAINYQYSTFYTDSETRNISFGIETCPSTLVVGVSPAILISDRIENVTFDLTNNGTAPLTYISMHASVPSADGTFLGIQPIEVSSIAAKSTKHVNESVFIYKNATQSFPINLTISYYNGTQLEQVSDNPIVLSSGIINITAASITLSPAAPTAGSIFSVSFVLTDIGTSGASAVTATPETTTGFTPYGSNSVFVGDMAVDSQTPVTLTLTTGSSLKSGNYTIPVKISYLNALRENLSTTLDVRVPVTAAASTFNALASGTTRYHRSSGSGFELLIIAVIVIIIIVLVFLYYRSKRRKTK